MRIVDLFYTQARQHRAVRGFRYGKGDGKGGTGDCYPLVWVDDPVYFQSVGQGLRYTVNFDVLGIPDEGYGVIDVQRAAQAVGLDILERLRQKRAETGYHPDGFSGVSLRDYYDDGAAGWRFTASFIAANPVSLCEDPFDPEKKLPVAGRWDKPCLPNFCLE